MKTTKILLALILTLFSITTQAQNEKTITVIIKDFSEACGQDPGDAIFCLTDEKGQPIKERYTCNMEASVWKVEPKDLITDNWTLNPKYKGKTAKLYCKAGGGGWFVEKVELINSSSQSSPPKTIAFEKDNFKTATCRAYDITGKLVAIVDNNTIYPIKDGVKKEDDAKGIQNKDEVCVKGTTCIKVKVEADGLVNLFYLPNVTDKTPAIKIVGDKIYRTQKKNTDIDETKEYYIFKGNKTHAALIAVVTRMGMGH